MNGTVSVVVVGVLAVLAVAIAILAYVAYAHDWRQIQRRSRRHADGGGRPADAPDATPGHGGGAAGG